MQSTPEQAKPSDGEWAWSEWIVQGLWPMTVEPLEGPHEYYIEWRWTLGHERQYHGFASHPTLCIEKIWLGPLFIFRTGTRP